MRFTSRPSATAINYTIDELRAMTPEQLLMGHPHPGSAEIDDDAARQVTFSVGRLRATLSYMPTYPDSGAGDFFLTFTDEGGEAVQIPNVTQGKVAREKAIPMLCKAAESSLNLGAGSVGERLR